MTDETVQTGGFSDQFQSSYGPSWLTIKEILALHEKQLERFGGPAGLRDSGALESVLNRARNKWEYEGADLAMLGAAHAYGIARNHPFVDGNKRAAFVSMMLLLRKNGVKFAPPQTEATKIMLEVAAGNIGEEGLARWIRDNWPKTAD
jgi:death-on-curing protein